jgi:hypothetical protein
MQRGGRLHRFRERMRALPFSREEQFGLLEVALREQLRREGKPLDAIKLQRPDDLPAPADTPVRQAGYERIRLQAAAAVGRSGLAR